MNKFKIVSIDGNIGSGKSTLLQNLKDYYNNNPNIIFLKEPVDEWETIVDENNITILENFYSNQEKYSFSFQMMAYISRLSIIKDAINKNPNAIFITERSLMTDRYVFAKMLFDNKKIELINYKIYLKWFDNFYSECPIHKVIYVNTIPKICYQRIIKRDRIGENNIPLNYLISCDKYHNEMLEKFKLENICDDQLILDGNIDIYENSENLKEWIEKIDKFIK